MATDARLSQLVAEILRTGTAVPAELSQVVAEVLRTGTAVPVQLSQVVLELLRTNGTEGPLPPPVTTQPHMQVVS